VGSKKNDNTALKQDPDFISDVLTDELKETLEAVPQDGQAEEFFESLKNEVLEEGVLLEPSQVTNINLVTDETEDDFSEPEVSRDSMNYDTNPVRQYDDKTALVDEGADLSLLDNVDSLEMKSAEALHQNLKRNPSIDLKNADYIRFAQDKIKNQEKELLSLREEAQELALAGSHFKTLADEREQRNKTLEAKVSELQSTSIEEKRILNEALAAKETKVGLLQERVESLELELESKYNRLRVRERELESRLEILKQEQDAVFSSKDDMILRVKKQNNALTADLERLRSQAQKTSAQLQEKEDALRRTIKALKLSLTMLESQKHN
jgi:chromosome segregation ATPase